MQNRNKRPDRRKELWPCLCCGEPFLQDRTKSAQPCNSPRCLKLQAKRKAALHAVNVKTPESYRPSETTLRYGHTDLVESVDGLKEASAANDDGRAEPDDIANSASTNGAKSKSRTTAQVKRFPSLEQPVVAAPIGTPEAPFGYDEADHKIAPPKEDRVLHQDLMLRKRIETARCSKHPNFPGVDCFKCREENHITNLPAIPRPLATPIVPPKQVESDPQKKLENDVRKFLGLEKKAAPRRSIPLNSTATAWSSTSPTDISKYNRELAARAAEFLRKTQKTPKTGSSYRGDLSFRKILFLSPKQIAAWLMLPEILYVNEPSERLVSKTDKFKQCCAEKIRELEQRIADDQHEIVDLEERREVSGLSKREITTLKKRHVKDIEKARAEITQVKRSKLPEDGSTEHMERRYSGAQLDPQIVKRYLEDLPKLSEDGDDHRVFENAVIMQAIRRKLLLPPKDILVRYPELMMFRQDESEREAELHADHDAQEMGLSTHGKGRNTTGRVWNNKALETFDGVFKTFSGGGDAENGSHALHPGAADFDPSDDTN